MIDLGLAFKGVLDALTPEALLWVMMGIIGGLIFGILPGVGPMTLMVVAIPFTYDMDPSIALSMLIAMYAVGVTGGSVTSIVIGVPGDTGNAATILDGFPLAKKGKAARAIGAALTSSGLGGLFGGIILALLLPAAYAIIMHFGCAETFLVALVGLGFVAAVSRGSTIKGIIAAGAGILLSFVGYTGLTAVPRFAFGQLWLYDGFGLIPFFLGLFAVPEVIELALTRQKVSVTAMETKWREVVQGMKDVFIHWRIFLQASVIGVIIGMIPGIGSGTAQFVAYAQAKASSKNPEEFGSGRIEGVIGPESANNATQGGAMLPTVAFGIPGSVTMCVVLGAIILHGIVPGPEMLKQHLDLTFSLVTTLVLANLVGAALMLLVARWVSSICLAPPTLLAPAVLVLAFIGVWASTSNFAGFAVMLIFGVIGYAMVRYDFNRVALAMGFILGDIIETWAYLAYKAEGFAFLGRPTPLILIIILILVLFSDQIRKFFARGGRHVG